MANVLMRDAHGVWSKERDLLSGGYCLAKGEGEMRGLKQTHFPLKLAQIKFWRIPSDLAQAH